MPPLRSRLSGLVLPGLLAFGGGFGVLTRMANGGQPPHGALLGGAFMLLCVAGLLRLLGLVPTADASTATLPLALAPLPGERLVLAPAVVLPVAAGLVLASMFVFGGHALPFGITLALLLMLPAALRRPSLLVFVIGSGQAEPRAMRAGPRCEHPRLGGSARWCRSHCASCSRNWTSSPGS